MAQWFVQKGRGGSAELVSFLQREVRAALSTEALDLVVKAAFHTEVAIMIGLMINLVLMDPMIQG